METIQGQKYLWRLPLPSKLDSLQITASYNVSFPIAQFLFNRGYTTKQALDEYLFSSLERDVAHPMLLKDAQKAVDRIIHAINNKEKILIAGDYDVDGITSSALMLICLLPLGAQINFFLPNRVRDGYGLSTKVIQRAADNNYSLVITVDNGITAFEPALLANQLGIDLIITDHHRPHGHVPEAFAIINPHQDDCLYPYKKFAGVGVIFKVMSLLYEKMGLTMPAKAYELLLLGTVADVVPLTGENRFWVRHGLHYVNKVESLALKVLKKNSKLTKPRISATDIGFFITPQINALGRLEDARQGVKFLIGSDEQEVETVGQLLFELNQARKDIERSIFSEVVAAIESKNINLEHENIIIAASNKWSPGVIGLVASRLVGIYGKPVILFHLTRDGMAKGSCRSIAEFNMFNALQECQSLLATFGGHSVAAGLALKIENVPELKKRLEAMITAQLTPLDLQPKIRLDAEITLLDVTKKLVTDLELLEPFGNENQQPVFYLKNVIMLNQPQLMKDVHVKISVFADGIIKPVLFFNRPELYELLINNGQNPLELVVQVTENVWQGKTNIELTGLDIRFLS